MWKLIILHMCMLFVKLVVSRPNCNCTGHVCSSMASTCQWLKHHSGPVMVIHKSKDKNNVFLIRYLMTYIFSKSGFLWKGNLYEWWRPLETFNGNIFYYRRIQILLLITQWNPLLTASQSGHLVRRAGLVCELKVISCLMYMIILPNQIFRVNIDMTF